MRVRQADNLIRPATHPKLAGPIIQHLTVSAPHPNHWRPSVSGHCPAPWLPTRWSGLERSNLHWPAPAQLQMSPFRQVRSWSLPWRPTQRECCGRSRSSPKCQHDPTWTRWPSRTSFSWHSLILRPQNHCPRPMHPSHWEPYKVPWCCRLMAAQTAKQPADQECINLAAVESSSAVVVPCSALACGLLAPLLGCSSQLARKG